MTTAPSRPTQAIARRTIEDALHAWLAAGTGLGVDRVFWQGPGVTPPSYPFATLSWIATVQEDHDAVVLEDIGDETGPTADLRYHVAGFRFATVSLQAFADVSETGPAPEDNPGLRLDAAIARLCLPTVRGALIAAGITNPRATSARQVADGQWAADLTFYVEASVSEDVFSIQSVSMVPADDLAPIGEFTAPPPTWEVSLPVGTALTGGSFEFGGVDYQMVAALNGTSGAFDVVSVGALPAFVFAVGAGGVGGASVVGAAGGGGGGGGWAAGIPVSEAGEVTLSALTSGPSTAEGPSWSLSAGRGGAGGSGLGGDGANGEASSTTGITGGHAHGGSGGGGAAEGSGGTGGTGDTHGHDGRHGGTGGTGSGGGGGGIQGTGDDGTVDGGDGGNGNAISALATAAIGALLHPTLSTVGAGGGGGSGIGGSGGAAGSGGFGVGGDEVTAAFSGAAVGAGGGGAGASSSEPDGGNSGPAIVVFCFPVG